MPSSSLSGERIVEWLESPAKYPAPQLGPAAGLFGERGEVDDASELV